MAPNKEYLLGDTAKEVERLQKQHAWVKKSMGNKLIFAPVDLSKPDLAILDVGCADDVASTAKLVGGDLMPNFFPPGPQGNITYETLDVTEPFPEHLQNTFDLTHLRYVLAGAGKCGIEKAIENLAASVKSGGYLQVQEMDVQAEELDRPAFNATLFLIRSIFDKTGMGADMVFQLKPAFEKAGLADVKVEIKKMPAGKLCGNEVDMRNSLDPFKITIPSIIQGAKGVGADVPDSITDNLQNRFEEEMTSKGAQYTVHIITGRKV